MIRGLLITTVVSFVIAVVCMAGAGIIGGPDWDGPSGSFMNRETCTWSKDHKTKTCESSFFKGSVKSPVMKGPQGVRKFAWTGGDTLVINAPAQIRYTQGAGGSVTITGAEEVLERLTFKDGELELSGRRQRGNLVVTVEAPNVTSFRFNGGQKIEIANYAQDVLKIEANGAVDLRAKGAARMVDLRMNGASNADLDELVTEEAKIELNGASNASIKPKRAVDIRINGVGNVSLGSKPPHMTKEIHGIGGVSVVTGETTDPVISPPPAPPKPPSPARAPASTT